jgi:hypothetical protein
LSAQFFDQIRDLLERHVTIVVAMVGLDETVKGDNCVSIGILGIYYFAAPQNIVADGQPARFE